MTTVDEGLQEGVWLPTGVLLHADLSHLAVRAYALLGLYAAQDLPQPRPHLLANRLRCTHAELRAAMQELRRKLEPPPAWLRRRLPDDAVDQVG